MTLPPLAEPLPGLLFESLCRDGPDLLVVVDGAGLVVFANGRCRELLGYEPDELRGKAVEDLVPGRFANHAAERADFQARPSTRAMGGRTLVRARHRDGHEVPVDVALAEVGRPADGPPLVLAVVRDATRRFEAEHEQRVRSVALEAAANGIVITDRAGVIRWANPAILEMTGYSREELVGQHTRILKSGLHGPAFYRELWEKVLGGKPWFGSMTNRRKDGTLYHEEQHVAPVVEDTGEITHFIAIKQDVTARRAAEAALEAANGELRRRLQEIEGLHRQLREQAVCDALTGLFNRRYLDETLPRELARVRRDGLPLSLVLIDVDHFKQVNDTQGHAAGDAVLRLLGGVLTRDVRRSDMACRLGGDEFLVVMPGAIADVAERRAQAWRHAFAAAQDVTGCSISVGVAELAATDQDADALLRRADNALYSAKAAGRDRVVAAT